LELCEEVKKGFGEVEDTIAKEDKAARKNPLKKKKKATPSKEKGKAKSGSSSTKSAASEKAEELDKDVSRCYTDEVLENNPALQMRVANRLDRWIGRSGSANRKR
jgi:hypothetical protein